MPYENCCNIGLINDELLYIQGFNGYAVLNTFSKMVDFKRYYSSIICADLTTNKGRVSIPRNKIGYIADYGEDEVM